MFLVATQSCVLNGPVHLCMVIWVYYIWVYEHVSVYGYVWVYGYVSMYVCMYVGSRIEPEEQDLRNCQDPSAEARK